MSLAVANGDFSFTSITTVAGAGPRTTTGSERRTTILPGVSAGLSAIFQLTDSWSAYGGARYQYYSDMKIETEASKAELDFGSAFIFSLGAIYSF